MVIVSLAGATVTHSGKISALPTASDWQGFMLQGHKVLNSGTVNVPSNLNWQHMH